MAFTTTVGAGGTSLIGTSGVDTVALNAGNVAAPIYIGAQADDDIVTLTAATNTANVEMGRGADIINANGDLGTATIRGNDGNDTISLGGDLTNSLVNGNAGIDTITMTAAGGSTIEASTIHGGQGNDTIAVFGLTFEGGRINGNIGDDSISVGLSANMTGSGSNAATINGGQGADTISAFGANALISGDDGNDTLNTFNGNDTIYGGSGQDLIAGGFAADTMVGGDGVDTFSPLSGDSTTSNVFFDSTTVNYNSTTVNGIPTVLAVVLVAGDEFKVATSTAANSTGFDVITDFTAGNGGDRVDTIYAFAGAAAGGSRLLGAGTYAISGNYSTSTGLFEVAATNSQGADTLILDTSGLDGRLSVVLRGTNATQIVASNIV